MAGSGDIVGLLPMDFDTTQQLNSFDYLQPFIQDVEMIVSKKPMLQKPVVSLLAPFEETVWVLLLSCIFLIPLLSRGLLRRRRREEIPIGFMIRQLLVQGSNFSSRVRDRRILAIVGIWMLLVIVFQTGYRGVTNAMLVTPGKPWTIDSLDDLATAVEHRGYYWSMRDVSKLHNIFKKDRNVYPKLMKVSGVWNELPEASYDLTPTGNDQKLCVHPYDMSYELVMLKILRDEPYATIQFRTTVSLYNKFYRGQFHVSKESIGGIWYLTLGLSGGSHYYDALNNLFYWVSEHGITKHERDLCGWRVLATSPAAVPAEPEVDRRIIYFWSLHPAFFLLYGSWFVGVACVTIEILLAKTIRRRVNEEFRKSMEFVKNT